MISLVQLGTVDYATGLRLQQQLVALRKEEKIGDVLLLLEHSPVITLGRNAKAANIIAPAELLAQRGVELFETDRGGDVTFHGPGQIVGYPIFDLRGFDRGEADCLVRPGEQTSTVRKHLGAVDFVRRLEEVLIRTCADFAIPTKRVPGLTGVWTDTNCLSFRADENDSENRSLESRNPLCPNEEETTAANSRFLDCKGRSVAGSSFFARNDNNGGRQHGVDAGEAKLAAIGIHISRFVTSHGFALNVNTDLSYFNLIIPCGITAKPVTSMQKELSKELDLNTVAESISRNIGTVFSSQMLWVETLDALLGHAVGVPLRLPAELRLLHEEDDSAWA
ncbi:MAG: lipoyl(octanoyl) transferase [Candidatus Sulfotelmatobacter sp.]